MRAFDVKDCRAVPVGQRERALHVDYLAQLEALARREGACLTVTVSPSRIPPVSVKWKVPGKRAEEIESLVYEPADDILAALLVRLGVLHQLPTRENIVDRLTPNQ